MVHVHVLSGQVLPLSFRSHRLVFFVHSHSLVLFIYSTVLEFLISGSAALFVLAPRFCNKSSFV